MQTEQELINEYIPTIPNISTDELSEHFKIASTRNPKLYSKLMETILKELRSRRKPVTKEEPCESIS